MNKTPATLPVHELARRYPELPQDDYEALKEDIKRYGLQVPIVLFNGEVIDGRHRLRACQELGIEPKSEEVGKTGQRAEDIVTSLNEHRRHLTEGQRALIAARAASTSLGSNQHTKGMTQGAAAIAQNVSKASVQRAKAVMQKGHTELVQAVERGVIDVTNAEKLAGLPQNNQQEIITAIDTNGDVGKQVSSAWKAYKREQIIEANKKRSANNKPLSSVPGRYGVVYADPPWDYISPDKLGYPTMSLADICAMPVPDLAEEDAVLFLWCSASLMREALKVIEDWGFLFKSQAIWDKDVTGTGMHFRVQHEHLFIATRGNPPPSVETARPSSVLKYKRREHSRKPDEVREMIDAMYPELTKVELFCRGKVPAGWMGWGNEFEGVAQDVGAAVEAIEVNTACAPAANDEQPPRRGRGRPRKQV